MADGLRSNPESTPRRFEEPPGMKASRDRAASREVADGSRRTSTSIKDTLGDYSEQTGAFFG